jgi:flagellum-specific peptidoglycan hydrolase FlgJ
MRPADFIFRLTNAAIAGEKFSGVPASITIAQAALESSWGESSLAKAGNNLFGIKADSRWHGDTLTLDTKEFIRSQWVVVPAKWRKYSSWQESLDDHAKFLCQNPRYQSCFLCQTTGAFARALFQVGYATDPTYAEKLMKLISQHKLQTLDGGNR